MMENSCFALDPIATAHYGELALDLQGWHAMIMVTYFKQQVNRISQKALYFIFGQLVNEVGIDSISPLPP
jgi:ABC-type phosphate transport system ATPase subunit